MANDLQSSSASARDDGVSRREFLGGAALTTAGVAAGLSYYYSRPEREDLSEVLKPESQVRLGFIGVGNRGGSLLRTALQVPGTRAVAVADVQKTNREDLGKYIRRVMRDREKLPDYHVSLYDYYRRLLDNKEVEGVFIATPHYLHGSMALDAIEAGKHVYCEKAMAFTIGENQDIYDLVRSGKKAGGGEGLVFQVGHQRHYSPLYRKVHEMVLSDQIGDIAAIRGQWNLNDEISRPCDDLELEKVVNWRLYSDLSGGLTTEYATHQIDVANWLLGTHPDSVCGTGGVDWYYADGRDTHDNIHLVFTYRVPVVKRDYYGRIERTADGRVIHEKDAAGRTRYRNVCFDYMSIMQNEHLNASESIFGRYGTIEVSLGGGEFFKEKKAREDPNRIAEGTNPRRALQKSILKGGATVDPTTASISHRRGDPVDDRLPKSHWTRFAAPIEGAYDKVETLLAVESFVKCIRRARRGESFADELRADVEVGMWSAVPALMANIAMRESRTVYWREFFPEPA
jgi:predicted dehydrogenase